MKIEIITESENKVAIKYLDEEEAVKEAIKKNIIVAYY